MAQFSTKEPGQEITPLISQSLLGLSKKSFLIKKIIRILWQDESILFHRNLPTKWARYGKRDRVAHRAIRMKNIHRKWLFPGFS